MKKKALIFCLLVALLLLAGCGRNHLLKSAGNNVHIYRWDGEKTVGYWTYEVEKGRPVVKALKQVPAKEAPQWTADLAQAPLYGISVDTADGTGLEALWTGGYWIDREGNAWTFDFDFEQLIADTEWHSTREYEGIAVPGYRYVAQNGNSWNPAFLNPAAQPDAPKGVSMTVKSLENGLLTAVVGNDGSARWQYGLGWQLDVQLEDGWYTVPLVTSMDVPAIAYLLEPGQTGEQTFDLSRYYGDLPAGQYRVVFNGLTAPFTLP